MTRPRTKDFVKPDSTTQTVSPSPAPEAADDLQAYVNAARARRRGAEESMDKASAAAAARESAPSEDEVRMATIRRNLNSGTSGVFQIMSLESRTAAFSFRGWTTDASNARREYIQVEIGNNPTIELAVVRKMIELIRRYYKGYFNWESQRLDRIVTLSARQEDNEGLEDFMMKEFFGTRPRPRPFGR